MPNAYDGEQKLKWLEELDRQIWLDLIQTHVNTDGYTEPTGSGDTLVREPFASDVYVPYLQACIAWHNEEDARYDRYITRFNDGYLRFARWYNETHTPLSRGEYWGF